MTLEEIKTAIAEGKTVYWSNEQYQVRKSNNDYNIVCLSNNHTVGLTWADGKTMNGDEDDFFIKEYNIVSPDGYNISHSCFNNVQDALDFFQWWKKNFETQGYYSDTNRNRLPLDKLHLYCALVTYTDSVSTVPLINLL